MKAWVLHDIGDLRYEEVETPVPKEKEVLLRVRAAGICGSDLPRIYATGAHKMPLILGHEFSGVVEAVGPNVSPDWRGKRVGVCPLLPCMKCGPCREGKYALCRDYDYLGSRRDGGFAEYVTVPERNLIELPGNVSFAAAAMLEPAAVAAHAICRTNIRKDDRILVIGPGTIGSLVVMCLKACGIERVTVAGRNDANRKRANTLGADYLDVRELESGKHGEWDAILECVGKAETVRCAIEAAAPHGKVTLVGNPAAEMSLPRDCYWKILRNELTLLGSWNSSFPFAPEPDRAESDDWRTVLTFFATGRIAPESLITHRLPLAELGTGLRLIREKTEGTGKVLLLPS